METDIFFFIHFYNKLFWFWINVYVYTLHNGMYDTLLYVNVYIIGIPQISNHIISNTKNIGSQNIELFLLKTKSKKFLRFLLVHIKL